MDHTPDLRPLVLLVEDNHDTREMYALALGMSGFRTAEAGTAAEARASARSLRPNVIVSDLTLPDGDGCELCAELSEHPATRGIPTIALTGRSSNEDIDRCAAAGCVQVLVKPCSPDALAEAINAALAGPRVRRD